MNEGPMDKEYYIKKWLDNTLSDEERDIFERTEDFQKLKRLSDATQAFKAPHYNVDVELDRLSIKKASKTAIRSIHWMKTLLPIAAVLVVVLAGFFYFYLDADISVQTVAAEKTELYLPDSSQVILNAFSKISYNKNKWSTSRQVNMEGEAYFDVSKGSRFDVITTYGSVSVLGTHFNVKSRIDFFEVICYEGLVQVQVDGQLVKLPPNHSVRINNGMLTKSDNNQGFSPSWLDNESSFQSVPFVQVIQEFERQYDVSVRANNVDLNQLFTGRFVHDDQALALQEISVPLNLTFELTKDKLIILSGKGD